MVCVCVHMCMYVCIFVCMFLCEYTYMCVFAPFSVCSLGQSITVSWELVCEAWDPTPDSA